jgi:hypothetical protein
MGELLETARLNDASQEKVISAILQILKNGR